MKQRYSLAHIERMLRYWQRQRANAVNAVNGKEKEAGKETLSPTPPNREKGEEKEDPRLRPARASQPSIPPVIDIHRPPTIDELLEWGKPRGYTDERFIRSWHKEMCEVYYWCFPKSGKPLNHWPAYFAACYRLQRLRRNEQTALPRSRKADNWRGTNKEDLDDVLA